jgi:hypothetical protein
LPRQAVLTGREVCSGAGRPGGCPGLSPAPVVMSMIFPACGGHLLREGETACQRAFVARHKAGQRSAGDGYKSVLKPRGLGYCFLQAHRAGESIQDKSQDARLLICHTPAYD